MLYQQGLLEEEDALTYGNLGDVCMQHAEVGSCNLNRGSHNRLDGCLPACLPAWAGELWSLRYTRSMHGTQAAGPS